MTQAGVLESLLQLSISNTAGRVLAGWISDYPGISALVINNLALILCSGCVFLFPFCSSYVSFAIIALLFGLFVGIGSFLFTTLLIVIIKIRNL